MMNSILQHSEHHINKNDFVHLICLNAKNCFHIVNMEIGAFEQTICLRKDSDEVFSKTPINKHLL